MSHKIVWFADNSDRYYDFSDRHFHLKTGEIIITENLPDYEYRLLELLVDNAGEPLSRNRILDYIKGDGHIPELKSVDNHISMLRKHLSSQFDVELIKTVWKTGYSYVGTKAIVLEQANSYTGKDALLPHILTKSTGKFVNRGSVIYRERELEELKSLLANNESAILLRGFGGIGKTSLAQVLYAEMASKYDSVGWIGYHRTLKDSLLEAIELFEETTDPDKRWKAISAQLKNDRSKKILFIDNVDRDVIQEQEPMKDSLIQDITGWSNMTVVLTSRIASIPGYYEYPVETIGSEDNLRPCVDLFYFYYDRNELKKKIDERQELESVIELVKRAGFHTYAIELLAKSAIYENTLSDYLMEIRKEGFQFPSLEISTYRHQNEATAAEQLRLLFNMRNRGETDRKILWDFSVLPEGISLTQDELTELLRYSPNDLRKLCQESWIRYKKGQGFFIHPLVREIVHFGLNDGKAPYTTVRSLVELILNGELVSENDPQNVVLRKLNIIENAAKYLVFTNTYEAARFFDQLGHAEYAFARKRLTSIGYLEQSLQLYKSVNSSSDDRYLDRIADVKYRVGYIKSATHIYREDAQYDLKDALAIWDSLDGHQKDIAKAHDHLGYVLSDHTETYVSAKEHLTAAYQIRKELINEDNSQANQRDYATTCDNLGFLMSKAEWDFDEATRLLTEALSIRNRIYEETGLHATDVAWTSFNLGKHLSQSPKHFDKAEVHYNRALEIRKEQEKNHPGMYVNNIVFTSVALAKLLAGKPERIDEVRYLVNDAIARKSLIDPEHTGYFSEEVENDLSVLTQLIQDI